MGKKLYILVILMAGLMVLGHVVISHHHHHHTICCTVPSHDQHDQEDACSLEKAVILPQGQNRTEIFDVIGFNENPLLSDIDPSIFQLAYSVIPADPTILFASCFLPANCLRGPPAA